MTQATQAMLKTLTDAVAAEFAAAGFVLKRGRHFERVGASGRTHRYTVGLSKQKGWYSLHLTLGLLDRGLMAGVNAVLEQALRDEAFDYPETWLPALVESTIKARVVQPGGGGADRLAEPQGRHRSAGCLQRALLDLAAHIRQPRRSAGLAGATVGECHAVVGVVPQGGRSGMDRSQHRLSRAVSVARRSAHDALQRATRRCWSARPTRRRCGCSIST